MLVNTLAELSYTNSAVLLLVSQQAGTAKLIIDTGKSFRGIIAVSNYRKRIQRIDIIDSEVKNQPRFVRPPNEKSTKQVLSPTARFQNPVV